MNDAPPSSNLLVRALNWLLYSNVFIALCALGMTVQTTYLLPEKTIASPALMGLVFFSTLAIYALHRLVSARKVGDALPIERFAIIRHYQRHIWGYTGMGVLGAAGCFFILPLRVQSSLLLPAVLSLGYVLPFLKRGRRLRDLHYLKIFLIAGVWAYVTVGVPGWEAGAACEPLLIMSLERALFIFLITLPFDLRDAPLDAYHAVKTLPTQLGVRRTLYIATGIALAWAILVGYWYTAPVTYALWLSGIYAWILVLYAPKVQHDYYYTGLLDGTMLVQTGLVGLVVY